MNCYIHPEKDPVGNCTSCDKPICTDCAIEVKDKLICRECLGTGKAKLPQSGTGHRPAKDRSIALILEILPGLFGFLGFGWIYSGNTSTGVTWLVCVLIWNIGATLGVLVTGGFGCFIAVPVNLVLIAISASSLNTYIKQNPELFDV
jgi:hypothetical protein